MKRAYVVWNPEHGTIDKNAASTAQVPVHKIQIVEAESPKKAISMAARHFLEGGCSDVELKAVLSSNLGSYSAKIVKYTVYFKRVVWRIMRSE